MLPIREKLLLFYKLCVNSQREGLFCTTGTLHGIDPPRTLAERGGKWKNTSLPTPLSSGATELVRSLFCSTALNLNSKINQM